MNALASATRLALGSAGGRHASCSRSRASPCWPCAGRAPRRGIARHPGLAWAWSSRSSPSPSAHPRAASCRPFALRSRRSRVGRLPCSRPLGAGTLVVAARLAVGGPRVKRLSREATVVWDADWIAERTTRPAVSRSSGRSPSRRATRSRSRSRRAGAGRCLLVGRAARLWAVERRRIVLLHELAHVKRADWPALLVAELAVALYWFHPLAHWLGRRVRREAEQACDELVIASGTKPSVYAGHLLGIFRSLGATPTRGAGAGDRASARLRGATAGDPRPAAPPARPRRAWLPLRPAVLVAVSAVVAASSPQRPAARIRDGAPPCARGRDRPKIRHARAPPSRACDRSSQRHARTGVRGHADRRGGPRGRIRPENKLPMLPSKRESHPRSDA